MTKRTQTKRTQPELDGTLSSAFATASGIFKNLESGAISPVEAMGQLKGLNVRHGLALDADIVMLTAISTKGKASIVYNRMAEDEDEDYEDSAYEDSEC